MKKAADGTTARPATLPTSLPAPPAALSSTNLYNLKKNIVDNKFQLVIDGRLL